jgi:GNAT superfamily N-acetyltransferase
MIQRRYVEPARSYVSVMVLLALMVGGFLFDLIALGGGGVHALAWVLATIVIVGFDLFVTHAVRGLRSIVVTDSELRVGESVLPRDEIVGVAMGGEDAPVLGRRGGEGLPRGMGGLTLQLTDGRSVIVASRDPRKLASALGAHAVAPEVRVAEPDDLEQLPDIDNRAESLFRVSGLNLPELPFPIDALHDSKIVYVAGRPPVAFVQVDEVDGNAHIQELAVLPAHMRQGLGSLLLDAACLWAQDHGYPAITLTTYADVAWNAPFYAARGFTELSELTPELAELRDWERDVGLDDVGRRVAMRRAF